MKSNNVTVNHLSHRYDTKWAIKDINFEIGHNGVIGLLGSNGAGKSTTMNIMAGVISPLEGSVIINGVDIKKNPVEAKKLIGFLPQSAPLYTDLTVDEYLRYTAHLRLIDGSRIKMALDNVKQKCGLSDIGKKLIGSLSGGYRQRVGIAQSIIHTPQVVIMDEPTNGLDPIQILEVRKIIKDISVEHSIIFSSHILAEIKETCQDIIMIENGQVIFKDEIKNFNNYLPSNKIIISFGSSVKTEELLRIGGVITVDIIENEKYKITVVGDNYDVTDQIIKSSYLQGWNLREIYLEKPTLEDVFAALKNKIQPISC